MPHKGSDTITRWQLRLTGTPRLTSGERVVPIESLDVVLLAWLAIEGPTPRTRLLRLMWPDDDHETTLRNRLRQRLFSLKRRLTIEAVTGNETLSLSNAVTWSEPPASPIDPPLLDGFAASPGAEFTEWIATQRRRDQERRRADLAERSFAAEREGRIGEALALAQQLVEAEPLQEHGHRRLMRLHYLRGDRSAALAAFDACERVLKDELGVRPGAETLELLAQIESSQAVAVRGTRPLPVTLSRPPRMIGRQRELQRMQDALRAGRHAVVIGEAGMGKSRLLAEAAADAAGRATSAREAPLSVCARPGDADLSYALFARLVRALHDRIPVDEALRPELARIVPELGAPATTVFNAGVLEHVAERLLRTQGGPLLVDDLHFADVGSVELLARVAAADDTPRAVFGLRPTEGQRALDALEAVLKDAHRLEHVRLAPLDVPDVTALIDSLGLPEIDAARLAEPMARHTGGNPQFILETLRALLLDEAGDTTRYGVVALPLPAGIGALIEQRLRRLSPAALRLARAAAVMGADFSSTLAAHVLQCSVLDLADSWRELESASVLSGTAFAHDLVYEAVLRGIPAPIAQTLHATVAQHLSGAGAAPARVARHWLDAGDLDRAAASMAQAAQEAASAGRDAEATRLFHMLANIHRRRGDGVAEFDALRSFIDGAVHVDTGAWMAAAVDRMRDLARDDRMRAWAESSRATYLLCIRDYDRTLASTDKALAFARACGDEMARLDASLVASQALLQMQRLDEAGVLVAGAQAIASAHPALLRAVDRIHLHEVQAWLDLQRDRFEQSIQQWRKLETEALAKQDIATIAAALNYIMLCEGNVGRFREAAQTGERQRALITEHGLAGSLLHHVDNNLAFVYTHLGHYADALAALERAEQVEHADRQTIHLRRAGVLQAIGQNARARQELQRAGPVASLPSTLQLNAEVLLARFLETDISAEASDAREQLARIDSLARPQPRAGPKLRALLAHAQRLEGAEGLAFSQQASAQTAALGMLGLRIVAEARCAQHLVTLGDADAAVQHASIALALLDGHQPEGMSVAQVGLLAYRAFAAADKGDKATHALAMAADWIHMSASRHVPAPFRDAFLNRHAINRAVLTLSTRMLRDRHTPRLS